MVRTEVLDLLQAANAQARDAEHYCADLLAAVFPHGRVMPTEEIQASVKAKLFDLVVSIASALCDTDADTNRAINWELLARSGLLRQPSLIEFALARIAEDRICCQLEVLGPAASLAILPTRLLGQGQESEAQLSRQLLSAEQRRRQPQSTLYLELDPDTLYQLFWRVADIIYPDDLRTNAARVTSINVKLAAHNEGARIAIIARKLLFALGEAFGQDIRDPRLAGLHLFVAGLVRDFGIDHDFALRLIDGSSLAPLAIMLAAREEPVEKAAEIIATLRGLARDDAELPILFAQYPQIRPDAANDVIRAWNSTDWKTG